MPKVLLVEDNEMNRDMLSRRLARRGFDVVIAVDGQQGVEMARGERPDIILMDMSLPVLDGWGATRIIKKEEATRSIPLIALTAHAMAGDRSNALECGCDDYDIKPIEMPRLLEKMERLLANKTKAGSPEPNTTGTLAHFQHELQTRFNQILGYTEMLLEDTGTTGPQEIAPALVEIHSGGRILLDRIQGTLADRQTVSLRQMQGLVSEVRPEIERLRDVARSLCIKLRQMGAMEALADAERVASSFRMLLLLLRQGPSELEPEPVETATGIETAAPSRSMYTEPGAERLLIVEDDAANRDLLRRRLTRRGYAVEVAENGPAALEKISQAQYDLVLLDQMMPGMSGVDLLRLLRATYSPSELPVIMVTAVDQSETVVEALDQGANDYLAKTVEMPVVVARIQAQLARSKADRHTKLSDPLTGLSNRLLLSARMAEAIARQSSSEGKQLGVLLLDLDGFKVVNDSFGHGAGDQLLLEVAVRLKVAIAECSLTEKATIARIGGDEFAVLIEDLTDAEQPKRVAEAIQASLASAVSLHSLRVAISASIGIALCGSDDATPEQLLRNADLAMYRAKELGKNRWQMFDTALYERAQTRMAVAIDLRRAVERGELLAVYQPKVDLQTRTIVGFEALLRWRHPERGLLDPCDFISVAEETGLIIPIGEWIITEACRQLKTWQDQFPVSPPLSVNVNLSVKQLGDPNLLAHIRTILAETGIPPDSLRLELTESNLMSEIESAKDMLTSIQALNVGLNLDDFGTGYSSLSYLRMLHFDSLKIDQSFVEKMVSDPESHSIVETVVNLAHALRMTVVAEGIENEQQLAQLIRLGCDTGQGFYFSKPLHRDTAEKLLSANSKVKLPPSLEGVGTQEAWIRSDA